MLKETWKKVGVGLLVVGLLGAHIAIRTMASSKTEASAEYSSSTACGTCKIAFPVDPQRTEQSIETAYGQEQLTYEIYQAPLEGGSTCLLLVATYPHLIPEGQELSGIEWLLNGIISKNPENQLAFAHLTQVGEREAVDFLVESPTSYFRAVTFVLGNKLYVIAMEGREGALDEQVFEQFVGSFSLN